ncbi:MAG: rane protein involved in the export of O-antigen and teichoic acid [Bacteriovoracaceae bacterium]|nr:rane protein involved in the export of O-antigen and teichoic acid [Bacteriovoracaceae bacterium]
MRSHPKKIPSFLKLTWLSPLFLRTWKSPTLLGWIAIGVRFANVAFIWPLALRAFSEVEVAIWGVFGVVAGLQVIIDNAFSDTFVRIIAYARGSPGTPLTETSSERLATLSGTMVRTYAALTIIFLFILAVFGTWSVKHSISLYSGNTEGLWIAWLATILGCITIVWANQYAAILVGVNQLALLKRIELFCSIGMVLSTALVFFFKGKLVGFVLTQQFWILIQYGSYSWMGSLEKRKWKQPKHKFRFDSNVFLESWPVVWRSWLGVFCSFGAVQISSIIYAHYGSVSSVASYLFAFRIIQLISLTALVPFQVKIPLLAAYYFEKKYSLVVATCRSAMQKSFGSYVFGFLVVGFFGPFFLQIIKAHTDFVDLRLWGLMGLGFFLERYGGMHIQLYSVTNKIIWHIANPITGLIFISLCWILFPKLGVFAFPTAQIISNLAFFNWYTAYHSYTRFKMKFWPFEFSTSLVPLVLILAYIIATTFFNIA